MVPIAEVEFVNNCLRFVPITMLIYDWTLMLEDEVDLIWRRPFRTSQCAFLALRYGPIIPMSLAVFGFVPVSDRVYRIQSDVSILAMMIIIAMVQILLQVRVYAMYNRSRVILWTNAALFVAEYAVTIYLFLAFSLKITDADAGETDRCRACSIYPRSFALAYVAPLCYESYLLVLAARKGWAHRGSSRQMHGSSTVGVLVRGNVQYFFLVASGMAISLVLFLTAPRFVLWVDLLTDATGSIGGTRLILSVRKALLKPPPLTDPNTIPLGDVNPSSTRAPWAESASPTLV